MEKGEGTPLRLSSTTTIVLLLLCLTFTVDSIATLFFLEDVHIIHTVWASGWVTCVTTALGAVPFICWNEFNPVIVELSNALAAGMMGAASYQLLLEGFVIKGCLQSLFIGALLGVFLMICAEKMEFDFAEELVKVDTYTAKRMFLILGALTIHSFAEGVGLGVSFHSTSLGGYICATLAIHNIPEGLALCVALVPMKLNKSLLILLCIFSSIAQPLMSVPAFTFANFFTGVLPYGLGFAAGAMLYVSLFELFLGSIKELGFPRAFITSIGSGVFMLYLQALF